MVKRFAFVILLVGAFLSGRASDISVEAAGKVARNFYFLHVNEAATVKWPLNRIALSLAWIEVEQGRPVYYVFNVDKGGFIIISGDNEVMPVLGYSFKGEYSRQGQPPAFIRWMQDYADQIRWVRLHHGSVRPEVSEAWNLLLADDPGMPKSVKSVTPMLYTEWDQGKYYNEFCPDDPAGPDDHAYAGCVPTAMAQIMNYYRWPLQGTGSYTYVHPTYDTISADFGNTFYRWNEMPLSLNTYNSAVATLFFHPGVAVDLNYGPNGSGMYNHKAAYALRTYFGYSPNTEYIFRDTTSLNWKAIILNHLDNKMPLYYAGWADTINESGHAFVCDGYQDTTYFHFNWGWSGSFDGYFMIDMLTPGGADFTLDHELIVNIFPDGSYPYFCNGTDTLTPMSATIEDGSGPIAPYGANADCRWLIAPYDSVTNIKVSFLRFDLPDPDDRVIIYNGDEITDPVVGNYTGSSLPSLLTVNSQKILLRFISDDTIEGAGWLASYTTTIPVYCSGIQTLTASSGHIEDGSGPRDYHNLSTCRWRLQPPGATSISIHVNSMGIGAGDFFSIYNQDNGDTLCYISNDSIPPDVICQTGNVLVYFKSDGKYTGAGFDIDYTVSNSINENNVISDLKVTPNPSNGLFTLTGALTAQRTLRLEVLDGLGTRVKSQELDGMPGDVHFMVDLRGCRPGLYLLKISGAEWFQIEKLIIAE